LRFGDARLGFAQWGVGPGGGKKKDGKIRDSLGFLVCLRKIVANLTASTAGTAMPCTVFISFRGARNDGWFDTVKTTELEEALRVPGENGRTSGYINCGNRMSEISDGWS